MRYLIVSDGGLFFIGDGQWSKEYPDAKLFPNLQAARRVDDKLLRTTEIYSEEAYAEGKEPVSP